MLSAVHARPALLLPAAITAGGCACRDWRLPACRPQVCESVSRKAYKLSQAALLRLAWQQHRLGAELQERLSLLRPLRLPAAQLTLFLCQ